MKFEYKLYLAFAAIFIFYCVLLLSLDSLPAFLLSMIAVWIVFMLTLRLVKGFCEKYMADARKKSRR